jgi:soluble lytic murein transglycosylase-like protein
MRFAAIALILGCIAMVCHFAMRSGFFHSHTVSAATTSPVAPGNSSTAPLVPVLSKAETLSLIATTAAKHQVPEAFVAAIVAAESNFDCAAVSPKGAVGLMQLMPETAQQFGANPAIPAQNIEAGTRYLRWLMERYQKSRDSVKRVIAAYNAGPGMVDRYRGVPPFRETRTYVTRVMGFLKHFSKRENTPSAALLARQSEVTQIAADAD